MRELGTFVFLLKFLDLGVLLGQENMRFGFGQLLISWNCLHVLGRGEIRVRLLSVVEAR